MPARREGGEEEGERERGGFRRVGEGSGARAGVGEEAEGGVCVHDCECVLCAMCGSALLQTLCPRSPWSQHPSRRKPPLPSSPRLLAPPGPPNTVGHWFGSVACSAAAAAVPSVEGRGEFYKPHLMPHLMALPTNILQGLWPRKALFMGLRVSRRLQVILGWWGDEGPVGEDLDRVISLRIKQLPLGVRGPDVECDDSKVHGAIGTLSKLHWRACVEFSGPPGGLGQLLVALKGRGAERIVTLEWLRWENEVKIDENLAAPERAEREARMYGTLLLAEGLRGAMNIESLYLRACFVKMQDTHVARSLFAAISMCSRLKSLDLSDTLLSGERLQDCMSSLTKLTNLEELLLDCNEMGSEDFGCLGGALPKMRLTGLQLAMVGMLDEGAHELAAGLCLCTSMTSLRLGHSDYDDGGGADDELCGYLGSLGGAGLALCLPRMRSLVDLRLSTVVIEDGAVAGLATGLAGCWQLEILRMDGCRLSEEGATRLAPALGHLTALEELDLIRNDFGTDGVLAVANKLTGMSSLRELSLQSDEMSEEGLRSLAPPVGSGAAERPFFCLNVAICAFESGTNEDGIFDCVSGALRDLICAMAPPQPDFHRTLLVYLPGVIDNEVEVDKMVLHELATEVSRCDS